MRLQYKVLLVLFISITCISAKAQNANSLLWEISGNGLKTPSYLYGSIHITNKKVFDFPDSVIAKLRQCETTAFELEFDSVAAPMLKDAIKKEKNKHVRDILSQNEIEKLKKELKKKNIPADDIDNETPTEVYKKYTNTIHKKSSDNMSTFLDAYLFGIAKSYGKSIIGLETYNEQLSAINDLKENDQKELLMSMTDSTHTQKMFTDSLISLYMQENINRIYDLLHNDVPGGFEDIILIKRNYVMDRRIDSLVHRSSAFICVGAGHLAGDEGLISLLTKRGYTIKPVQSPRTGYYKTILPQENLDNWKTITDKNGGYQIQMPGEPTPLYMYGIEMKGYVDLGKGYFYLSSSFPSSGPEKSNSKKATDQLLKRFESMGEISSKKSVKYNNMQGIEVELKIIAKGDYIIRVLNDTDNAFVIMIGGTQFPEKNTTKKFFNSLVPIKRSHAEEIVFKDDTGAFQMKVPPNFKMTDDENSNGTKYKVYTCMDYGLQGIITVTYADYAPGSFFPDVDKMFDRAFEPLKTSLRTEPKYVLNSIFKGYSCRDYKILTSDNTVVYARYILRSSRFYAISVTSRDSAKSNEALKRIQSFDFIAPLKSTLALYTSSEKDFKVLMPGPVEATADSLTYTEITHEYGASDPNTGNWFKIYSHVFSNYEYLKNDSACFAFLKGYIKTSSDSLLDSSLTVKGTQRNYDFRLRRATNTTIEKNVRGIVNGKHFYLLVAIDDLADPATHNLNSTLFNSFEITNPDRSFDVFGSKTDILLADLQNNDTNTFKKASAEFKNHDFEKGDLKKLEKTLEKQFPDDTDFYSNTRYWIYHHMYDLMDTAEKINFIKTHYSAMPDSGNIRINALNELAIIQNPEAMDLWKHLILSNRPKPKNGYGIFGCMGSMSYDSLPLIKSLYPDISQFIGEKGYKDIYYSISSNALKHKIITTEMYAEQKDKILNDVQAEYKKMKTHKPGEPDYYSSSFEDAVYMLNLLPVSESMLELNKEVITDTVSYSKLNSFLYLYKNNVPIDRKTLKEFLKIPSNRNDLYDGLQELNKLNIFPSDMKKQKSLAEGDMYSIANSEDDLPIKLELVDEKKVNFKGQLKRFYIYRISYEEEANSYFGIAGPYPASDKELVTHGSATSIGYETEFDPKGVDEYFKKTIEDLLMD